MPIETYQSQWPEEIDRLFNGGTLTKQALDSANKWVIEQLGRGKPDLNKFQFDSWVESMKMLERRIQQAYKSIGMSDEDASREIKKYQSRKGGTSKALKMFNDGGDKDFQGPPQTLEQLVMQQCGPDSDEWENMQRLKGLFGVPLEVVDEKTIET